MSSIQKHCWNCKHAYTADELFCKRDGERLVVKDGYAGRMVADRYLLQGIIGEGGYGQVYVATVKTPPPGLAKGRNVAIKLLKKGGMTLEQWDKYKRSQRKETKIASKIKHPNLLEIFDSGEDSGTESLFVVMPLGKRDLKQILIDEGPSSEGFEGRLWHNRVFGIASQVCEALATLHDAKIYHCDVKPANVMEVDGGIKLIDYGIAKVFHDETLSKSAELVIRGTPEYICPDYWEIEEGREDTINWTLVDQYAFGVMMYELLSGAVPFNAPPSKFRTERIIEKHRKEAPKALNSQSAPAEAGGAVLRMLEKNPARRFPDMRSVREALVSLDVKPESVPVSRPDSPEDGPAIEISGVEVEEDAKTRKKRYVLKF